MKNFIRMLKDDSGASAAEYALILAIVGAAIAVAASALGNAMFGRRDEQRLRRAASTRGVDCSVRPATAVLTKLRVRGRRFGGGPTPSRRLHSLIRR